MKETLSLAKKSLKETPVIGPLLVRLWVRMHTVRGSAHYWEQRYKAGGNSGVGSYDRLAQFKADFLNRFVDENHIATVIEFGSGDGAQLQLAKYPSYVGTDISPTAVENCRRLFAADSTKHFMHSDALPPGTKADLALSLDVVYHLIEDSVFDAYMRRLFLSADRFVIVYSSNVDEKWTGSHVRHRQFTRWVEARMPHWRLHSVHRNAYPYDDRYPGQTSPADFYVFARS